MATALGRVVALIPARGGSKSIPHKNIKALGGRPLLHWVLAAACGCPYVHETVVSTDGGEIRRVVEAFGNPAVRAVDRSPATATDTASSEAALLEYAREHEFDHVIMIQATSPLLTTADLTAAVERYSASGATSLVSVVRQRRFLWEERGDHSIPINYDPLARPRRQDHPGLLVENGAFYITSRAALLESGCRISGRIIHHEMPEDTYFELDEPGDWVIMEGLLRNRLNRAATVQARASHIKLFAMDCDGVLTDAGMYYSENGDELKKFNTRDGMGIRLLHEQGMHIAIITGEDAAAVRSRARKLGIPHVYCGVQSKLAALDELVRILNLTYEQVAYIGDDLNDADVMSRVGLAIAVQDAHPRIRSLAHMVTERPGGRGAVREACEVILEGWQGEQR